MKIYSAIPLKVRINDGFTGGVMMRRWCNLIAGLLLVFVLVCPSISATTEEDQLLKALQAKLEDSSCSIFEEGPWPSLEYGDFNHDGQMDVASIVGSFGDGWDRMNDLYYVWIGTLDSANQFKLLFEWDGCNPFAFISISAEKSYSSELGRDIDVLVVRARDTANSLETIEIVTFKYINNAFSPVYLSSSYCSWRGDSQAETTWDFERFYATDYYYNYNESDDGESGYASEFRSEYYFFIPLLVKQITVDGALDEEWQRVTAVEIENPFVPFGASRWSNVEDAGLIIRTAVSPEYLYIFAEVTDDRVVWDKKPQLKQDHLEIWLCSDEELYQVGVYPSGTALYYPKEKSASVVQSTFRQTGTGFVAEIAIPFKEYGLADIQSRERFGFTLVFSDTDSVEKPAQDTLIATSALKWGKAATLGEVWLDLEYFESENYIIDLSTVWDKRGAFQ